MEFSKETLKRYNDITKKYSNKRSALLNIFYLAQKEFGSIGPDTVTYISTIMEIPESEVKAVASFYTMIKKAPVGKYHIQVCTNLSCSLLGVESIVEFLKNTLKIDINQTTPDKKFTLSTVECLGSCGTAPVMMINDDYYENLTEEKIEKILSDLK